MQSIIVNATPGGIVNSAIEFEIDDGLQYALGYVYLNNTSAYVALYIYDPNNTLVTVRIRTCDSVGVWGSFNNTNKQRHYSDVSCFVSSGIQRPIITPSDSFIYYDETNGTVDRLYTDSVMLTAYEYFTTPQSGSGTATVEIDIEGENLVFESEMLGKTITRFIDGDAEVDMEDE